MNGFDLVVLGLSLSSSWGNGHATTYRALLKAYAAGGRRVLFLERDQPWYADHRDLENPDFCTLEFYQGLDDLSHFRGEIARAGAVVVGSYTPDGAAICGFVQHHARGVTAFYDIDTPVTLAALERNACPYLSAEMIPGFDLYLSFTGGPTLARLARDFQAKAARALYCAVDPELYRPLDLATRYDLGYLGTYAPDRQPVIERLLIEPARRAPELRFVVAGPQYRDTIDWPANVARIDHVGPQDHAAFYGACRFTLNATRRDMVRAGYSPSVRLFEAAACETPIISDAWRGLESLFAPGADIVVAADADDVLHALRNMTEAQRRALARGARARVLDAHTAAHRAEELAGHIAAAQKAAQPA
ncbi:Spore maturation protein CgeB [Rhodoblastus acidophilus]|uniref:Spore maturation protein CgeB n=1 Tax=Rhodoblastus acidophilus TaxID=1074 RepID=A0A212RQ73_RHOAC|nr:glycosyltransferase [Rhodoblastus acidophilus]PPQ38529.1 glycosyltransferase [Rhodoblastus acidophilus]RAI21842.1 glycosyltransferase [Rhodoblastus acidophilus]SNB74723.1 Spore maturation protein CgeB [Rhodoblastus acidophilus]